jgi:hypothetical protein
VNSKFTACFQLLGIIVGNSVQADAKFLRRVLLGLVLLTLATGTMAGLTAVQAMTEESGHCVVFCK